MSPTPSRRRPEIKGNVKVGICTNNEYINPDTDEKGPCPKCASGEHISVEVKRLSDFRCPVCGNKLTPVKVRRVPIWIWRVAAAIIACLVLIFSGVFNKVDTKNEPNGVEQPHPGTPDSQGNGNEEGPIVGEPPAPRGGNETGQKDTAVKVEDAKPQPKPQPQPQPKPQPVPQSKSSNVLGGAAEMISNGGNITIKFKRTYQLDTGDSEHSIVKLFAGDEIYMANVRNGYLYGGQIKRNDGQELAIHGIKVKL